MKPLISKAWRIYVSTFVMAVMFAMACSDHDDDHGHSKSRESKASKEHSKEKSAPAVTLSDEQVKRLGLGLVNMDGLRTGRSTYRVPGSALVLVRDSRELYLLDDRNRLHRVVCHVEYTSRRFAFVRISEKRVRGRLVISNAAMARLAWLNQEQPGSGHGH